MPHQNPFRLLLDRRLPNSAINANDDELECFIKFCETLETWAGGIVGVGVLATVVLAIVHPTYDSPWERWGSAVADSLVAIGIFAEIKFSRMAGLRQSELKRRSDERVVEANKIAAQAVKEAAEARERTAEIEKLTAWRHIEPHTRTALLRAFAKISNIVNLAIEYQNGDVEAYSLAIEFKKAFAEIGINTILFRPNFHIGITLFGITGRVGICDDSRQICEACQEGLDFIPIPEDMTSLLGDGLPAPTLYFFVGPKPPPEFSMPILENGVGESNI